MDKNYVFTMDMSDWLMEKFKLGLDFPNLPYLIDGKCCKYHLHTGDDTFSKMFNSIGQVKLTRQDVILKYLGRKHQMAGNTVEEEAMLDQIMAETLDLHKEFRSNVYKPDFVSESM